MLDLSDFLEFSHGARRNKREPTFRGRAGYYQPTPNDGMTIAFVLRYSPPLRYGSVARVLHSHGKRHLLTGCICSKWYVYLT